MKTSEREAWRLPADISKGVLTETTIFCMNKIDLHHKKFRSSQENTCWDSKAQPETKSSEQDK